jgi:hypothetical protein
MNTLIATVIELYPLILHLKPPPGRIGKILPTTSTYYLPLPRPSPKAPCLDGLFKIVSHNVVAMRGPDPISLGALLGEVPMSGKSEGHGVMQTTRCVTKEESGTISNCPFSAAQPTKLI